MDDVTTGFGITMSYDIDKWLEDPLKYVSDLHARGDASCGNCMFFKAQAWTIGSNNDIDEGYCMFLPPSVADDHQNTPLSICRSGGMCRHWFKES